MILQQRRNCFDKGNLRIEESRSEQNQYAMLPLSARNMKYKTSRLSERRFLCFQVLQWSLLTKQDSEQNKFHRTRNKPRAARRL